jgi:hypothetical protein
MADEAGRLEFDPQTYSLSSVVVNSERWSAETHAIEPRSIVLHRMQLVTSLSLNPGVNVELATAWDDQLYSLARAELSVFGADQGSVTAAFAWMIAISDL